VGHEDVLAALRQPGGVVGKDGGPMPLREARARFEHDYILERLASNRGNLNQTARDLGIERTNLYRKMRQLGISAGRSRR
jgi:DNA-binding NtrC family response regulator